VSLVTWPWIVGTMLVWMLWLGPVRGLDVPRLCAVTVITTVCAVTITHIYETGYLIKARARDALHVERLEHARAQAQLDALRSYIDPHFLFNNLNTLSHLIADDPDRALAFNDSLAEVYRYILCNRGRDLVLLREEVAFLRQYYLLLRLRFGPALELDCDDISDLDRLLIPPISLQVLVENAVKHNSFDRERPLDLVLWIEQDVPHRHRGGGQRLHREVAAAAGGAVIRVLIIEDERPAVAKLRAGLQASGEEVEVVGVCDSVRSGVQWLESQPHPDLILADIQLTDGTSFQIFEKVPSRCPIVFVTAYDAYLLDAFSTNGIDYLLKPVRTEHLAAGSTRCRSR
jgi:CheY-like chemotaxis protein